MIKRVIFILTVFFLLGVRLHAQRITNVRFEPFGRAVRVHYTLSRLPFDSFAALNLYVSTNGGESFTGPLIQVQGDIGKVETNGEKTVIWQAMDEMGQLDGQIVFELRGEVVKEKQEMENLLMYNVSGSSCFGLMYGRVARWGGYVRGKTNFSFEDAPYTCDDSGVFNYKGETDYYVVDKTVKRSRLGITGRVLYRPLGFLYLYAGAGYGYRRLMWHAETFDYSDGQWTGDLWAVNTQNSADGVEAELGGIFRYKKLAVSLGMNTVGFSFFEVNGAVGFFF
ncbi:MAG: hypothetical protein LUH63_17260 [Parabacteroides sp.]|nr:hypothetical protein [Parabacteroides sp.]